MTNNILIVEDDASICKALSMGLSLENSHFDIAQDGHTGIKLGQQKAYDVILADLGLPDMNGLDLIREIKELSPDIIPIVITGSDSLENSIEAIRLEVSDYLIKPLDLTCLKDAINKGLKKRDAYKDNHKQRLQKMFDDYQKTLMMPYTDSPLASDNETNVSSKSLAMLVHQINNPLTTISANAEMAMSNLSNKRVLQNYLKGIIRATASINRINEKIVAIDNPVNFSHEKFDIKDVMMDSLMMFEPLLEINRIRVAFEWTKHDCIISGDQFSIEQIFKNLILNAIEAIDGSFTKKPALTISIQITTTLVKVKIRDNGAGIPKDHLDKIYTSYFTTKKKGSGLGLPVIKQIVGEHQGNIEVKSKLGQGSEFTIKLPRKDHGPYWN